MKGKILSNEAVEALVDKKNPIISNVDCIGENAFKKCLNLYKVTSGHSKEWFSLNDVINNAFSECYKAKFELAKVDKSEAISKHHDLKINLKGIRDAIKNWRSPEK